MTVVRDILLRSIKSAFNISDDIVQMDVVRYALEQYNHYGQMVWNEWQWDNAKMEEASYTPDGDGVITLSPDVELVRAVWSGDKMGQGVTLPYDEVNEVVGAAPALSSETFRQIADDASGNRRIKVSNTDISYKVLALRKFVEAIVDPSYSPSEPEVTPTDYRVLRWTLDRAKPALVSMIADSLRSLRGLPVGNEGMSHLQRAIIREEEVQARDRRVVPQFPTFSEIGNWW